jgi:hypothetical protein
MAIEALFLLISSSGPQTKGSKLVLKVSFGIHFKKIHLENKLRKVVVNLLKVSTRAFWSFYGWIHFMEVGFIERVLGFFQCNLSSNS